MRPIVWGLITNFLKKINWYSIYVTLYASIGSSFCFFITNWVDSHAQEYYKLAYMHRWGYKPTTFFVIPSLLIFVGLLLIYRTKRGNPIVAGILASSLTFSSQFIGWLGFSFKKIGPLWVVGVWHLPLAVITGITVSLHFYSFLIPRLEKATLKLEYNEHLRVLGYLMQSITLIVLSGGVVMTITYLTQVELLPLHPDTRQAWIIAMPLLCLYYTYGAYGIFLLRFILNMINLKKGIQEKQAK